MSIEIVDDICTEACRGKTSYCTLKEIIKHSGLSDKTLEQIKCVELFKWQESMREGKDIGWTESHKRWVELGYAAKFSEVYKDGMTNKELHPIVMSSARLDLNASAAGLVRDPIGLTDNSHQIPSR